MCEIASEYKLECYRKIMPLGAKGSLWVVEDSVTRKRFVMRKLPMDSWAVYQRLSAIHHENIIEITDIFSHSGFLYVIEEYLEGKPLFDVISMEKLSHRRVLSIGRQLFNALLVLHENNIVHRDIKPENIMMDAYGNVKLIDFDIARLFTEGKNGDTTAKGSRDYAPPEQFGFAQTDRRTDIYSLGVTLNELAVGKLPEYKMCTGKLGIIIRRCIEFDPKRRYQSAEQALRHIDRLEKSTFLSALSVVVLSFILIAITVFILPDKLQKNSGSAYFLQDKETENGTDVYNTSEQESPFESVNYQDRIIYVRDTDRYPSFLMMDNREYGFTADLGYDLKAVISTEKTNEQLSVSCALSDGSIAEFMFDDVFSDIYERQGHIHNIDFERTSPEYEILLDDLNQDGILDLLITLAWRCRIDTPDPVNRYYLTEYSTLWVVHMTEDKELSCSEPLYFGGCTPKLETDECISNDFSNEWYTFENGIWIWN